MATRKQKAKVGLFLVICILLIAGGILLISGYRHEPKVYYWTEFHESVLGLGTNSIVTYLGVPVGTVSNIFVTEDNSAHVDMEIIVDKVVLKPGVKAQLVLYSLATGTLAIGLSGGDPNAPMLPPGSEIPSEPSLVETVSSKIETLLDNVNHTIDKVNDLLSGVEQGQVHDMVENATDVLEKAADFADRANETLDKLSKSAETGLDDFNALVKDVEGLVKTTKDAVDALKEQIESLDLGETNTVLNKAIEDIDELAKRLSNTAGAIEKVGQGAEQSVQNIQLNLRETLQTLNEALFSVKDLADYLLQNPSALIRGKGRPRGD